MFFILSKTLNYLTMPLVLIVLFFFLSRFLKKKKWRKISFWIAFSSLLVLSNDFLANEVMRMWEIQPTPYSEIKTQYEWGIVLTGVTLNDKEPNDRIYFSRGADRVTHTVQLYKKGIIKKILISGGEGSLMIDGRRESDDLFTAMQLMGVPDSVMVIENKSRNTHESAMNVAVMLKNDGSRKLLITSAFHMRRSKACFVKEGVDVDVFAVDFYTHPRYFTFDVLFIPKVDALVIWHKLIKEWVGMTAYKVAGYV